MALQLILVHATLGYDLGEDVPICWKTEYAKADGSAQPREKLSACPSWVDLQITSSVPDQMFAYESYPMQYQLKLGIEKSKLMIGTASIPHGKAGHVLLCELTNLVF